MVPSAASPSISLDAPAAAAVPAPRRRRRTVTASAPLGSLLQQGGAPRAACPACGTGHLTVISLVLTDGTAVRFSSCRGCEHRSWDAEDEVLSIAEVLERTRA